MAHMCRLVARTCDQCLCLCTVSQLEKSHPVWLIETLTHVMRPWHPITSLILSFSVLMH